MHSAFQDQQGNSVRPGNDRELRESDQSVAAPNGHNLATNDNTRHPTGDLGRVVREWQKLSAEARLMIVRTCRRLRKRVGSGYHRFSTFMKADSLANRADLIARRRRGHHARAIDGE